MGEPITREPPTPVDRLDYALIMSQEQQEALQGIAQSALMNTDDDEDRLHHLQDIRVAILPSRRAVEIVVSCRRRCCFHGNREVARAEFRCRSICAQD